MIELTKTERRVREVSFSKLKLSTTVMIVQQTLYSYIFTEQYAQNIGRYPSIQRS
jgi:hypothetical protein